MNTDAAHKSSTPKEDGGPITKNDADKDKDNEEETLFGMLDKKSSKDIAILRLTNSLEKTKFATANRRKMDQMGHIVATILFLSALNFVILCGSGIFMFHHVTNLKDNMDIVVRQPKEFVKGMLNEANILRQLWVDSIVDLSSTPVTDIASLKNKLSKLKSTFSKDFIENRFQKFRSVYGTEQQQQQQCTEPE